MTMVLQPWFLFMAAIMVAALAARMRTVHKRSRNLPPALQLEPPEPPDLADFVSRKKIVKSHTVDKFFGAKPELCVPGADAEATKLVLEKLDVGGRAYEFGSYSDFSDDVIGDNKVKSYELWSSGVYTKEDNDELMASQQASEKLPCEPFCYAGYHIHNWYMIEMENGHVFTLDSEFFTSSGEKHNLFSPYLGRKDAEGLIDERLKHELDKQGTALTKDDWGQLLEVNIGKELAQLGDAGAFMYFGYTRIQVFHGVRAFLTRSDAIDGMARFYSGGITDSLASKSLHARTFDFGENPPTFCDVVNSMRTVTGQFEYRGGSDFEDQGAASATQVRLVVSRGEQTFQFKLFERFYTVMMAYLPKPDEKSHPLGQSVSCRTLYWQTIRLGLHGRGVASHGEDLLEQVRIVLNVARHVADDAMELAQSCQEIEKEDERWMTFAHAGRMAWKALGFMVKALQDIDDPPAQVQVEMSKDVELVYNILKRIESIWMAMKGETD